jgi:hypothetical protein
MKMPPRVTSSFRLLCLACLVITACKQESSRQPAPAPVPAVTPPPVAMAREEAPPPEPDVMVEVALGGPRRALQPAQVLEVGKWPEGVAVREDAIWVSESGNRQVTRFSLGGSMPARASKVGRLPVDLTLAADGTAYVVVGTDKKIVAIDAASGEVRPVATTPDAPEALAEADGALWVLLWHANSTLNSTLLRVDAKTGATQRSGLLGPWAVDVAVGAGRVWVARDKGLVAVDPQSLEKQAEIELDDQPWQVLASPAGVYAGTRYAVMRVAPSTSKLTHRLRVDERICVLAMLGEELAAMSEKGTLYLLEARTLAPRLTLVPEKPFEPRAMVAQGDALFVTAHDGDGPGRVLVFRPEK